VRAPGNGPLPLRAKKLAIGWKGRGREPLSSGIDLVVDSGDFAVLVGPNGSGKSTLLRTLVGLQPALSGSVELCGTELRRISVEERATRVACVFTDRADSGYLSVFDVAAFGRYPYTDSRNRLGPEDAALVERSIAAVGLAGLEDRRFSELSDGERQKALVARAIAQDCPLLVLDEPTAFLDAPARVEIFHLARVLAHSGGKAVVFSTHDIDQALRYADTLLLMDRGHRLEKGAPEDLAVSGAIGRAFDGESFRFDVSTGSFRSAERGIGLKVELVGPEGPIKDWTGRLLERLGCTVCRAGSEASAIRVSLLDDRPAFELGGRLVQGYSELARLLEELLPD
jgi:iron complex transport system ATP-binding protein